MGFFFRYENLKPTAASFEADIFRYNDMAGNVEMQETVMSVHFLQLNSEKLKSAIIEQCIEWRSKLTGLLLRLTGAMVDHVHSYIADNSKKLVVLCGWLAGARERKCQVNS